MGDRDISYVITRGRVDAAHPHRRKHLQIFRMVRRMHPTTHVPFVQEYAAIALTQNEFDVLIYAEHEKTTKLLKKASKDLGIPIEDVVQAVGVLVSKGMVKYIGNRELLYRMTPYGKKVAEFDESTARPLDAELVLIERPS